ncbi:MAG: family 16 glycosylhydrolase [Gammaproteobacteria bacterium]
MNKRYALLIFPLLVSAPAAVADWEATFVDNFNGTQIDPSAWVQGREILPRRIQYYDSDAVSVENGNLVLSVLNRSESDRPYTAGTVTTQGVFKQQYGYFEMRARVPAGKGYWPAFWLMPETGRWTSEIDISEFRGHLTDTVHYGFHYDFSLQNENGLTTAIPVDAAAGFNNYAVHWTPDRIDYLFNGEVMHSVAGADTVSNAEDEMFMLLNVALASQHSGWIPTIDAETDLNGKYEIDYVRVYKEVPSGPYADIPAPDATVGDVRMPAYDNTALDVNRIGEGPGTDIVRGGGRISGALEVTTHKDDYFGRVSVILTEMFNFNNGDGRYSKSAAIEERNVTVSLDSVGDSQVINYDFDTLITSPSAYSVDVIVRDFDTNNKKSLGTHRVVQFVDVNQPDTTAFLEGFFRTGTASVVDTQMNATLQLQLQQAMLTPYLDVKYELVDTFTGDVLVTATEQVSHDQVGMVELSPNITLVADPSVSVGLIAEVNDASGAFSIPRYGVHVAGTPPPPPNWNPDSEPVTPPVGGGQIPLQRWRATFVDNFEGSTLNADSWIPSRDHLARRLQYYDKDALAMGDGKLGLRVLNRPESDRPYTSGTVSTQGLFKQQYGYFEMRAKIPSGNGFWPAFWLMPESGQWTSEIDIAEFRGQLPETVHHAYHYGFRLRNENGETVQLGGDLSNSYNNFAVYWTPERIDYLFNNTIVHSVTNAEAVTNANSDMYLILNLALSSQHASEWIPTIDANTDLSQPFSIDYVRVFTSDPDGEHIGIPDPGEAVADVSGAAYDHTALSVDRVFRGSASDILRSPTQIEGSIEVTSHRDDYDGVVSVMLVPILEFNPVDGRFTKGSAIATRNIAVQLASAGDSKTLDYVFPPLIDTPGAYTVDVVVRDTQINNKRSLSSHRFVQYVDATQPDTTVFFEGFIRDAGAVYRNSQVNAGVVVQMQQAMLAPSIVVQYDVIETQSENVVASNTDEIEHDMVGQMRLEAALSVTLNPAVDYSMRIRVSDTSGAFVLTERLVPIMGVGTVAPPTPHVPGPVIDGPITLPTTQLYQANGRLAVDVAIVLEDVATQDELLYNVRLRRSSDNAAAGKLRGSVGHGYVAGEALLSLTGRPRQTLEAGDYEAVIDLYKNRRNRANRIGGRTLTVRVAP